MDEFAVILVAFGVIGLLKTKARQE